jgi:bifunctional UDP-N-acetylglucosamine pyrophosphorylase/glucosamine-1-phosphate N-acetyltransferase
VAFAIEDDRDVAAVELPADEVEGLDHRAKLAWAEGRLRTRINRGHMLAGVTMLDPATTYIDASVTIEPDVTLEPNVILRGTTSIATGTVIRSGSHIIDTTVGRDCIIWASVLERSEVEDEVQIGPFSHLRPGLVHRARARSSATTPRSRTAASAPDRSSTTSATSATRRSASA